MKRYDPFFTDDQGFYCQAQMDEDSDGDWVTYEDANKEITRLRQRVVELEADTGKLLGENMNTEIETMKINGIDYVRADQVQTKPNGNRAIVVVDRGWIYAGDVTEDNGRIRLDRAVWLFRWESIGFAAVVADPTNSRIDIRKMSAPVDIPAAAEIFRIPVAEDWGL